ncbi:MAG: hypothetical protein IT307_02275 [Chloroflexi bacterium]|nr:hypothetical protein [Chloroflexota bacterium]
MDVLNLNTGIADAVALLEAGDTSDSTKRALRSAFLTRALHALSEMAQDLDDEALGRAAGARTNAGVLLRALEHPSAVTALEDDDPLALARLRGLAAREQVLTAEGGTLTSEQVAEHLRISRQAVDKRRQAGKLIGLDIGRHGYAYPAWQLAPRGTLPGLEQVLEAMTVRDPWMQAAFFLSGDPRLEGKTPLERLRRGDVDAVLLAARGYGEHGGV